MYDISYILSVDTCITWHSEMTSEWMWLVDGDEVNDASLACLPEVIFFRRQTPQTSFPRCRQRRTRQSETLQDGNFVLAISWVLRIDWNTPTPQKQKLPWTARTIDLHSYNGITTNVFPPLHGGEAPLQNANSIDGNSHRADCARTEIYWSLDHSIYQWEEDFHDQGATAGSRGKDKDIPHLQMGSRSAITEASYAIVHPWLEQDWTYVFGCFDQNQEWGRSYLDLQKKLQRGYLRKLRNEHWWNKHIGLLV